METKEKKSYCTQQQKQQLTELVTTDTQLLSGKFSNEFTFKNGVERWQTIAGILNSMPGANKQWKQWKKTWQDMKCSTKKKQIAIRTHMQGTGGGPPIMDILTPNEEMVLESMNSTTISGNDEVFETSTLFEWGEQEATPDLPFIDVANTPSPPPPDHTYIKKQQSVKRKRFTPAKRRALTANATQVLAQTSQRDLEIREKYYKKKIELMKRQTVAIEKIANHICSTE